MLRLLPRPRFLCDWGWITICCGGGLVLYTAGCSAAALVSTHYMPEAVLLCCNNRNCLQASSVVRFRYLQQSPGGAQPFYLPKFGQDAFLLQKHRMLKLERKRLYEWICFLSDKEHTIRIGIPAQDMTVFCNSNWIQINTNFFRSVYTFSHFAAPFILKKYSQPMCTHDKCILLSASKGSKSKWPGSFSSQATEWMKKMYRNPWGSIVKRQVQTEQTDGRWRHSHKPAWVCLSERQLCW